MNFFRKREQRAAVRLDVKTALADLGAARWSGAGTLVREGFERNVVGYRCVRLLSEAAASVPFKSLKTGAPAGESDVMARLLMRPNAMQAGPDLMESFYGHLAVSGESFLEAVQLDGEVKELHVLRPDRMRAVKGPRGWPVAWEHRVGSDARSIARDADGFLGVLHAKLFHPADDYGGHSPLEAAARAVDVHNGSAAWAKALMDNAARPSGAIIYSGAEAMTEEQIEDLRAQLSDRHQGAGNAGRPILLQGGLDWKPMSLTPAEMDFVEARHAAAREIALAFGVPPMLLGIPGDATYANYREANAAFWRLTVLPMANRAARAISGWLGGRMGGAVVPDVDDLPAFQVERAERWARIDGASFLSAAEKRKMAGV